MSKETPTCPFYGYSIINFKGKDNMISQEGNRCAFITDKYAPCKMEFEELKPLWEKCTLNSEENKAKLEFLLKEVKVLLDVYYGKRVLKLGKWMDYIKERTNS